jgi:ADP-ribose pyrophosphatase YjhB (NUDIX family)
VGAVVTDPEGRLLLVLRGRAPSAGLWSIPGGKVEPGETLVEAVRREVLEETALEVELGRYVGTVERPAPHGATFVIHDFTARPVGLATGVRAGDDAADVGWFTRAELGALPCVPGLVDALEEWGVLPTG